MEPAKMYLLVVALTVLSGLADARGFIHAARMWQQDHLVWAELAKSGLGFGVAVLLYWVGLRHLHRAGVVSPEVQALFCSAVTLLGVAVFSGRIFRWPSADQATALLVVAGIGWLVFRVGDEP